MKSKIALLLMLSLSSYSSFAACANPEAKASEAVVMLEKLNGERSTTIESSKQISTHTFRNLLVKTDGMYATRYLVEIEDGDNCRVMSIRFGGGQE